MEQSEAPATTLVGIDIAAATPAVVVLQGAGPPGPAETVPNRPDGWRAVTAGLVARGATPAATLAVMEATGSYWVGVAAALVGDGWSVAVVPPGSVRSYAQARLRRAKTDAVDAAVLAAYGRDLRPAPWTPPDPEVAALQLLLRQREDLVALRTQTTNRRHALAQLPALPAEVSEPLAAILAVTEKQIKHLEAAIARRAAPGAGRLAADLARLMAVQGVGLLIAATALAETAPLLAAGATARQVVAYAGLDPAPRQSGTSVRGAGHISKAGNARLRQVLYLAALTAVRCNPPLRAFYQRLLARGKLKKVALVAVARKLLTLLATLLIHQRTWHPDRHARPEPRP